MEWNGMEWNGMEWKRCEAEKNIYRDYITAYILPI